MGSKERYSTRRVVRQRHHNDQGVPAILSRGTCAKASSRRPSLALRHEKNRLLHPPWAYFDDVAPDIESPGLTGSPNGARADVRYFPGPMKPGTEFLRVCLEPLVPEPDVSANTRMSASAAILMPWYGMSPPCWPPRACPRPTSVHGQLRRERRFFRLPIWEVPGRFRWSPTDDLGSKG